MGEEKRIGLHAGFAHVGFARGDQLHVGIIPARLHPQPPAPAPCDRRHIERPEPFQRGDQRRAVRQQAQRHRQLSAVPVQRLGLAAKGVKARVIEIGGGKARIPGRQPAPRAVVETFAGDVHVIGVEHPVDKACHHVAGRQIGHAFDHLMHQLHSRFIPPRRIFRRGRAGELRKAIIDQLRHLCGQFVRQQPLECADADMRMRQAHHHRRSRRRRFVTPPQFLPRFDHREGFGGVHAQGFEHFGRQNFAHCALQRQPPVATAAVRGLTRSLGAEVEQPPVLCTQLCIKKPAPVADFGIVHPELMPVIPQRERRGQVAGQGGKAPEMRRPSGIVQPGQPDGGRCAIIAKPDLCLGKVRRSDRIAQPVCQSEDRRVRAIGCG